MSMTSFFKKKNEAKVYAGTPKRTQLTASESSILLGYKNRMD